MKKQYTTPEVETIKTSSTAMICVSASFGEGETDTMHAREDLFEGDDIQLWND